jgi:hypothetical protein
MNRSFWLLGALVLCTATMARAQGVPAPTPAPASDQHVYDDPAMHFTAPGDYYLLGRAMVDSKTLEGPTQVAMWAKFPGQPNQRTIVITLEPYEGTLAGYEVNFENTLREKIDGVFVDHKERTTTSNGMPAFWIQITAGSGFDSHRQYQYVWYDGLRGVSVSISGRLGELDENEAKAALKNIAAVVYPVGRI